MKIAICGSMAHHAEMKKVGDVLQQKGHVVEVPLLRMKKEVAGETKQISISDVFEANGGVDAFPPEHDIWKVKSTAIDEHFAKVAQSDAILVANYPKRGIDGYIGGNTLMEMAVAYFLKKKIYVLYPVASALAYKEEILGMHPQILNGNLQNIENIAK